MPSPPHASFELTLTAPRGFIGKPYLARHLRAAHNLLHPKLQSLSVIFVRDPKMIALHAQFLDSATTTDVLTFPLDLSADGSPLTGEIYVCLDEARRRARQLHLPFRDELLLYALHGMLHLCGFDDRTARAYRVMHAQEDKLLSQLGVGRIFDRAPGPVQPPRRRNRQ